MKQSIRKFFIIALCLAFQAFGPVSLQAASDNGSSFAHLAGQMKINYWTLFNSTDQQIRIDTASELLKSSSAEARAILLQALASSENPIAQTSVCHAISQSRSWAKLIPDSEDFIKPLMEILKNQPPETADLAAQASLIFSFKQVEKQLDRLMDSPESPQQAKLNVIYALQIRPDKEAVSKLIDLLDSKDKTIASAAGDALQEWLPVGNDRSLWLNVLKDLEKKSRSEILRERLLAQQDKIRQQSERINLLTEQIGQWQKIYIDSLDRIYLKTTNENDRAKLIAENLVSENSAIRIWSIEKINMWRKSGNPLPLDSLEKPLIALVADGSEAVRTATADLLGQLTNVNSAKALLDQLALEENPDIKSRQLTSLARVCNYALSPGSEIKIETAIRQKALAEAAKFIQNSDPLIGAEAIRNLILQNGIEPAQAQNYFKLIAEAYAKQPENSEIRPMLINEMTRLCAADSFFKDIAAATFGDIFTKEIESKTALIAEPAVTGLIRIDPQTAFELLKQKGFTNHPSQKIQQQLIETASAIGTESDLAWLANIVEGANPGDHKRLAADAIMNISHRCGAETVLTYAKWFLNMPNTNKDELASNKAAAMLELAEKKAMAEKNQQLLKAVRETMARQYKEDNNYDLAAKYLGILLQGASDPNQRDQITKNLLEVNLASGKIEPAKQLIANTLLQRDLSTDEPITKSLNIYLTRPNDPNSEKIFKAIESIEISEDLPRPLWQGQLELWKKLFEKPSSTAPGKIQPSGPQEK